MAALPKSPAGRSPAGRSPSGRSPAGKRRTSSGGGLRPVKPFGLDVDDGTGLEDDEEEAEEEEELPHAPREQSAFAAGEGVDEVEYAYGYVRSVRVCDWFEADLIYLQGMIFCTYKLLLL